MSKKIIPDNFEQMTEATTEDIAWDLLTDAEQREMHYLNEGIDSMWEAWAEITNECILAGTDDRPFMPQPMKPKPDPIWFKNFISQIINPLRSEAEAKSAEERGQIWAGWVFSNEPDTECPF